MALKFDGPELEELQGALNEAFPDDNGWSEMLTHGFGSKVAAKLSVKYGDRAFEVLRWAGARNRHDQLVRVARRANMDNPKLRAFEKKIGTSICTEHLKELEKLLVTEELETQIILGAARGFDDLPSALVENEDVRTAFRRIIDHLASMGRKADGSLPLYTFAKALAAPVGRGAVVEEWRRKLPISGNQAPPRASTKSLYLFVKCDTGYSKSVSLVDEIQVEMWLWRLDDQGVPLEEIPDPVCLRRTVLLGEVSKLISDLRKGPLRADLTEAQDRLVVAFCLSQAALSLDIERWKIFVGETEREIGRTCPVVIRSFERLYHRPGTWGRWNRQWQPIANDRATAGRISWFCRKFAIQEFIEEIHARDMTCAVLTHPSGGSLVASTIDAGIPAVIWTRSSKYRSSDLKKLLQRLVRGRLHELPDRLYEARRRGRPPIESIALLWDSYDRLPPDADENSSLVAPDR